MDHKLPRTSQDSQNLSQLDVDLEPRHSMLSAIQTIPSQSVALGTDMARRMYRHFVERFAKNQAASNTAASKYFVQQN